MIESVVSDELLSRLGIECVEDKIQKARFRWLSGRKRMIW